jgi:NAD(P)-dependent dehydrogenase (short-subunit alcohol dehydrogenase family)
MAAGACGFGLEGKLALVTGGSRGIGRALSLGLAQAGADVVVVYREAAAAADEVVAQMRALGRRGFCVQQDLGDVAALPHLVETIWAEVGPVDILVNNAGMAVLEPFAKTTEATWDRTLSVNLKAPFFLSQQVAEGMIAEGRGGRIINISSTNGLQAEAYLAAYNASKGALELLTKSLAIELAPHSITVNAVAPGLIQTEIAQDFNAPDGFWECLLEHIPLGRMGTPEDCVGAVLLLASDMGAYITGQTIVVDGGIVCEQIPRLKFGA